MAREELAVVFEEKMEQDDDFFNELNHEYLSNMTEYYSN